jgi:CHAD domain-containing protein
MRRTVTPISIFQQHIVQLQALIPGVRDGRLDSIHDARIATRRIREVLPLTHEWQRRHLADDLLTRFKLMGRSLGRVRDADVRIALLRDCERRIPQAAPTLVLARQNEETRRLKRVRKLVKRFERLSVDERLEALVASAPWKRSHVWVAHAGMWRSELRRLVSDRAIAARDAIAHATGVYFPNRAHAARIAIKKFRYAAEIADAIGLGAGEALIRDLKKAADVLGEQHDRQTLADEFADPHAEATRLDETLLIRQVLETEIADLHGRYLRRRESVVHAAEGLIQDLDARPRRTGAIAAAAVMAVAGVEIARRVPWFDRSGDDRLLGRDLSVRVAVPVPARAD